MDQPISREITDHQIEGNPVNDGLRVLTLDAPGIGGANHLYQMIPHDGPTCTVNFQMGGVPDNGVNGVTQEALLAIVIDRLRCFQAGPFACTENKIALSHAEAALFALHARTSERLKRGVEGKIVA